ncbi:MAG: hypothetical protein S4CHLAM45_04750 [Chlamydiales bacterium]|nr:hypothetical protein [Chlamydiales bacterium]MCH9619984.1 hypothetical protein [Chlamydiales bacterium]MCH9622589.1 hypothetical protein [Chlamydiales bacterium]
MTALEEINRKLEARQIELAIQPNQLNFSSFLVHPTEAGAYTNYPGQMDKMCEILDANLDIAENKIASADDAIFIYKNNWNTIDKDKIPVIEENLKKLQELRENLQMLKDLYESFIVEPGVILITDGEREDPDTFHLSIDPPTSVTRGKREEIIKNWQHLLIEAENAVSKELSLNLEL